MPAEPPLPGTALADAGGALPARRLACGPFELCLETGRLSREGRPVPLAPRPFALLAHLLGHAGRVVTKDQLLDAVWGHRHVSDSVLKVAVNAVRMALGDDAGNPRWVETVPRRGYRIHPAALALGVSGRQAVPGLPAVPDPGPDKAPAPGDAATGVAGKAQPGGNLPASWRPPLDRDDEASQLRRLLECERLVTLVGPGGVGKTCLALAVAGHRAPPDGVWLVRLDALLDHRPLLPALVQAMRLSSTAARDGEALAAALAPLRLRLVLDNAEHLVDALAALLPPLLAAAPGLQVFVTSQLALRLAGEQCVPLAPLATPADLSAPWRWADFAACRLLVAQIRALQPGFAPGAGEQEALVAICRALDGLPLALEMAAARVPLLGLAAVRQHLDDRFRLFRQGARDAPQRQRTLRAALDWTWGLLDAPAQRCLRWLSAFAGSFSADTAARLLAAAGDAALVEGLDALQSLQQQGLLSADAPPDGQAPRLRLLDSVRIFARERRQQAGEDGAVIDAHARLLCEAFEAGHAAYLHTPLLAWQDGLRPQVDDLRAALHHACADRQRLPLALALFNAAAVFLSRSELRHESADWHRLLRQSIAEAGPVDAALRARFSLATAALAVYGQTLLPAAARDDAYGAPEALRLLGSPRDAYLAAYLKGKLAERLGDKAAGDEATAFAHRVEDPGWPLLARRLTRWLDAEAAWLAGSPDTYAGFCTRELATCRQAGWHSEAWSCAHGLAIVEIERGRLAQADQVLTDTVEDLRRQGPLRGHFVLLALLAAVRVLRADEGQAAAARELAWEAAQLLAAERMLWWHCDLWALLAARDGRADDARRLRAWADRVHQAQGAGTGPMAVSLRRQTDRLLAALPEHPLAVEPALLDDSQVLQLAFDVP